MSKVLLGEVSHERKETCKGSKEGYPIVGLEHLIPEEITLTTWHEPFQAMSGFVLRFGGVLGLGGAYRGICQFAINDSKCSLAIESSCFLISEKSMLKSRVLTVIWFPCI